MQNVLDKFGRKSIIDAMPRLVRLDAPGVLHHGMGRGIEKGGGSMICGRGVDDNGWFGSGGVFTGGGLIVGICRRRGPLSWSDEFLLYKGGLAGRKVRGSAASV